MLERGSISRQSRPGSVTPSIRSEDSQASYLVQDLTLAELKSMLQKKTKDNFYLEIENEIFEQYLLKRDPEILKEMEQQQLFSKQKFEQDKMKSTMSVPSSGHSTASFYSPKRKITIPLRIRNEMIVRELETMYIKHEKCLDAYQKTADKLKCNIEELNGRCNIIENVIGLMRDGSKFTTLTEFKKFIESTIQESNERIDRIELKIKTMKSNLKAIQIELEKKIDPGNTIKGIDFEIVKIENNRLKKILKQTCEKLLSVKDDEDKINVIYQKKETKLKSLMLKFLELVQLSNNHDRYLKLLERQSTKINEENIFVKKKNEIAKSATTFTQTPSVLEFMNLLQQLDHSNKQMINFTRKFQIQQRKYQNLKAKLRSYE